MTDTAAYVLGRVIFALLCVAPFGIPLALYIFGYLWAALAALVLVLVIIGGVAVVVTDWGVADE